MVECYEDGTDGSRTKRQLIVITNNYGKIGLQQQLLPRISAATLDIGASDVLVDPEVRVGEPLRESRRCGGRRLGDLGGLDEGLRAGDSAGAVVADLDQEVRQYVVAVPLKNQV